MAQKKLDRKPESAATDSRAAHLFKPGQSGNPAGRPKGCRNKLGEAFVADLYGHWQRCGMSAIERVARDRPHDYLKVIASILPKDLTVRMGDYDDMTESDLVNRIRQLDGIVRPFLDGKDTKH